MWKEEAAVSGVGRRRLAEKDVDERPNVSHVDCPAYVEVGKLGLEKGTYQHLEFYG